MRIIAKRPHVSDCFLTPPVECSPWIVDSSRPTIYADKNGNGTGQTQSWIRLRCNDPKCTALALVHHWDFAELVFAEIGAEKL